AAAAEDVLAFSDTSTITGSYDGSTGTLTLSGTDTVAAYQAALRAVTSRDTSDTPSTTDRTVTFVVDDGESVRHLSAALDRTVHVVATDDPPTAASPGFTGTSRAVGNTTLVVHDAANGTTPSVTGPRKQVSGNLLTGATDPDSSGLTVVPATAEPTAQGGTVDLDADGDFVYHPPAGLSGSDTFTYSITDDATPTPGTGTGTVTISVATPVWYVDAGAPAGGDGRSDAPLNTVSSLDGAGGSGDPDGTGDVIFLYAGTYAGGLHLENGQRLLSQRAGLTVGDGGSGSLTLVAAGGGRSELDGGLVLAAGNTTDGVDLGTTGAAGVYALSGTSAGTATMNPTTTASIDNPAGGAINIGGSANVLDLAYDAVGSSGSSGRGIWITGASGSLHAFGGTIADATAADVQLDNDDGLNAQLSTTIHDTAGTLVDVANQSSGTVAFDAPIANTSTGGGIALANNAGATVKFTGGLDVTAGGSTPALSATGGGTLVVTDPAGSASNTLTGAGGGALVVRNTTIGTGGLTFQRLSSTSASTSGVVLDTTGSTAGLTVTGTGAADSGGVIQGSGGPGVALSAVGGGASFTNVRVSGGGDDGIAAQNVAGLALTSSTVSSNGNATGERGLDLTNVTGTIALQDTTVSGNAEDGLRLANGSGAATLTVTGGTIGGQSGAVGNDGVQVVGTGSGSQSVTISGTTFADDRGDHVQVSTDPGSTASQVVSIDGTSMTSAAGGILGGGITISPAGSGPITSTITDNTISGAVASAIAHTVTAGSSTVRATITGNTTTSPGADGVQLYARAAGTLTALVQGNDLRDYDFAGVEIQQGDGNGQVNASVKGNTITDPAADAIAGIYGEVGTTAGDAGTACLDVGDASAGLANSLSGSLAAGGVSDLRLVQAQGTVVRLPDYVSGSVPTYLVARNGGNSTPTATTVGTFTPYGAACPQP
ncbi:MAG TPA: right-handed parallel beta-helix repeat-containing protein, partial [Baekduia sp.]